MKTRSGPCWLLLVALWLAPAAARAQSGDSAMAQSLFDQAKALLASGRAAAACPKLEESQRLDPRSGTLINLASCYEQTGRQASAWSKYIEAATSAKASGNTEREAVARERAAALAPRVSKLLLTVAPALKGLSGLEIRRDGVVVGESAWGVALPSDEGEHQVVASAPGYIPFQARVAVTGEGQTITVAVPELAAQKDAPALATGTGTDAASQTSLVESPSSGSGLGTARIAALVAGGVGVVGVGLGSVFGLLSKAKRDEADKYCSGSACTDARGETAGAAAQTNGNISTVAMVVGGVALGACLTLWVTAPPRSSGAAAQVGLGLGTLEVKGTF